MKATLKQMNLKVLKETEKALAFEIQVSAEIAPKGGFISSLIKDKNMKWTIWMPKSMIEKDTFAGMLWYKCKEAFSEIQDRAYDCQYLSASFLFERNNEEKLVVASF